jgi:lipopolysaccharide transport system ATP-binding protein
VDAPIIELNNITKHYVLSKHRYGVKSMLLHLPQYLHDRFRPRHFTALSEVSLSIRRGEAVGLVGPNGCGKTTLLSIIGGVLKRYEGSCHVQGRIGMMLALKSGFENELSGRENIILNGIMQGMTRRQMMGLMDEIIDFAGIGEFIDSPVYQYSSGMQARLGFAVATTIRPEILLIDEVMAVGDSDFRRKCKKRMASLLARETTLILVSHKMADIKVHCSRVVHLERGRIMHDLPTEEYFKAQAEGD